MNTPDFTENENSVRLPVLAKFSLVPANWLFGDRKRIEAAIKSAAEKAAQQIGNEVNEIVEHGQVPVFWNGEGLKTCQQWIERHIREALGLERS